MRRGGALVSLRHVDVSLSGRHILRDVSFSLEAGSLAGLIGPNGAGKTTIFRVILGLVKVHSGEVFFHSLTGAVRKGLAGYVPQRLDLDPDLPLRARDLVGLGLDGHRLGVPLPSRRRRMLVDEVLHSVDATQFADERIGRLSGGEQQRVLIAHALVSKPKLLLLDEPLANLDLRSEQEIVGLLASVVREQGISVLISAHDINPLLPAMDKVIYVAAGRVAGGTVEEIVRQDVLSKLYGHHVDVIRVHDRILVVAGPEMEADGDAHNEGPFEQVL